MEAGHLPLRISAIKGTKVQHTSLPYVIKRELKQTIVLKQQERVAKNKMVADAEIERARNEVRAQLEAAHRSEIGGLRR